MFSQTFPHKICPLVADEEFFEEVPRQPAAEKWKDPWTDQGNQGKLPEQYHYAVVCSSFIPNPLGKAQ